MISRLTMCTPWSWSLAWVGHHPTAFRRLSREGGGPQGGMGEVGRQRRVSKKDDGASDPDWQPTWSPFILHSTHTAARSWGLGWGWAKAGPGQGRRGRVSGIGPPA